MTSSTTSRVALVTGANKGVGRAIAQQLAELGMTVYLGARSEERGAQAESELRAPWVLPPTTQPWAAAS